MSNMNTDIIIVDDDPSNTTLTKMLLELEGFTVTIADTIKAAHEAANPNIDAFIIDYHLTRDEKGVDLLYDIRAGNTAAAANCISIIASGDDRKEHEVMRAGADMFLCKPFTVDTLVAQLNILLSDRGTDG